MLVRVEASGTERLAGEWRADSLEIITRALTVDGVVVLDEVIDRSAAQRARTAFLDRYGTRLGSDDDDARRVGNRRTMVTISLDEVFGHDTFLANQLVVSAAMTVLGQRVEYDSVGCVCSLPGAAAQHQHRDGGLLFPETGLDAMLPAAALTIAIPLLDLNEVNGSTAFWPGSHRRHQRPESEPVVPEVPVGSVTIWDYRVFHGGTPHRGLEPRPLMYATLCRHWWSDKVNYSGGRPKLLVDVAGRRSGLLSRAKLAGGDGPGALIDG
jgi:ectoine hydroxylase-related dioxygenase (phytanoyl-CoA dioxygenase family)